VGIAILLTTLQKVARGFAVLPFDLFKDIFQMQILGRRQFGGI
jgi:hypothetical protein